MRKWILAAAAALAVGQAEARTYQLEFVSTGGDSIGYAPEITLDLPSLANVMIDQWLDQPDDGACACGYFTAPIVSLPWSADGIVAGYASSRLMIETDALGAITQLIYSYSEDFFGEYFDQSGWSREEWSDGYTAYHTQGYWSVREVSPVPLPATAPMLLTGATALFGLRRRVRG